MKYGFILMAYSSEVKKTSVQERGLKKVLKQS